MINDNDALWLGNPFPILQELSNRDGGSVDIDIFAQRASFPPKVRARLGATLCMGFIYIRATEGTVQLWRELYEELESGLKHDLGMLRCLLLLFRFFVIG